MRLLTVCLLLVSPPLFVEYFSDAPDYNQAISAIFCYLWGAAVYSFINYIDNK